MKNTLFFLPTSYSLRSDPKKRLIAHYAGKTITESPVAEAINERDKELLAKTNLPA